MLVMGGSLPILPILTQLTWPKNEYPTCEATGLARSRNNRVDGMLSIASWTKHCWKRHQPRLPLLFASSAYNKLLLKAAR